MPLQSRFKTRKKNLTDVEKKVSPVIQCVCVLCAVCVPAESWSGARCSVVTLRSGLGCSLCTSREAPRPAECVSAGWVFDYVLTKPCDYRHVSRQETHPLRHMSLTCWTALSTPHPPRPAHKHARTHQSTHARTHTQTFSPPSLAARVQSISVVLLHWGRVPCTTMLLFAEQPVLTREKVEQQFPVISCTVKLQM